MNCGWWLSTNDWASGVRYQIVRYWLALECFEASTEVVA